jgi:hypothetical protein
MTKKVPVRRYARRKPKKESPVVRGEVTGRLEDASRGRVLLERDGVHAVMIKLASFGDKGTPPEKTLLEDIKSVVERKTYSFPYAYHEAMVSTLDDLLGFGVVPTTVMRAVDERIYSVQEWVPNTITIREAIKIGQKINHGDLVKIAIIDIITGQGDRHDRNIVVTPGGRAYAIDNEIIFRDPVAGYMDAGIAVQQTSGERIHPHILKKLKALRKEDFITAFIGAPKDRIENAWKRKISLEKFGRIPRVEGGIRGNRFRL